MGGCDGDRDGVCGAGDAVIKIFLGSDEAGDVSAVDGYCAQGDVVAHLGVDGRGRLLLNADGWGHVAGNGAEAVGAARADMRLRIVAGCAGGGPDDGCCDKEEE